MTMAIGQGMVTVTPMELAVMVAAIGNGGNRLKPILLNQANEPEFQPVPIGSIPARSPPYRAGWSWWSVMVQDGV
ncbi:MAG: hypothetical protein HC805_08080 [Alkalinema sp. RL_2_19]|nr:hypothetical protein [Alkalinema sp. RL_2_19]